VWINYATDLDSDNRWWKHDLDRVHVCVVSYVWILHFLGNHVQFGTLVIHTRALVDS